jgi:hypothetical protein
MSRCREALACKILAFVGIEFVYTFFFSFRINTISFLLHYRCLASESHFRLDSLIMFLTSQIEGLSIM